jgi:hypothetical protein
MRDLARLQCGYLQSLATSIMANYEQQAAAAADPGHAPTAHANGCPEGVVLESEGAREAGKKRKLQRGEGDAGIDALLNGGVGANTRAEVGALEQFRQLQVATSAALCAMLELDYRCERVLLLCACVCVCCFEWLVAPAPLSCGCFIPPPNKAQAGCQLCRYALFYSGYQPQIASQCLDLGAPFVHVNLLTYLVQRQSAPRPARPV